MNEVFIFYIDKNNELSYYCSDTFDSSSIPKDIKLSILSSLKQNKLAVIGSNIHVFKNGRDNEKLLVQ